VFEVAEEVEIFVVVVVTVDCELEAQADKNSKVITASTIVNNRFIFSSFLLIRIML
jgi:hypothetical protein